MKPSSRRVKDALLLLSVCACTVFLRGDLCSGGGDGDGDDQDCLEAPALYAFYLDEYTRMYKAVRPESTWEITIEAAVNKEAKLEKHRSGYYFEGPDEYHGTTRFIYTVPAVPRLSCAEVAEILKMTGYDEAAARKGVTGMMIMDLLDLLPLGELTGRGSHTSQVGETFSSEHVVEAGFCDFSNPCANVKEEFTGCRQVAEHEIRARVGLAWAPEGYTAALLYLESEEVKLLAPASTQTYGHNIIKYEQVSSSADYCVRFAPVCVERLTDQQPCENSWIGYYELPEELPLQDGTYLVGPKVPSSALSDGLSRWSRITLRCTSGCECDPSTTCDDGRECTRDECLGGNCVYTPDDLIQPKQKQGDCRTCEGGEVVSFKEQVLGECDTLWHDAVTECSKSKEEWLVHWIHEFPGSKDTYHLCEAGAVPGSSTSSICDGAGACTAGQKSSFLQGTVHRECQSYDGQSLTFVCDAFCNYCK